MTLDEIALKWQDCKMDFQRRDLLLGPARAWFLVCQAIAQRRALPGPFSPPERLLDVFESGRRPVAEVQLRCSQLAANRQWTSDTVESSALTTLHAELLSTDHSHLPIAFVRDCLEQILGIPRKILDQRTVLFPVIVTDTGSDQGKLAHFQLELLDVGTGQVFLDPQRAFQELDGPFRVIFDHARDAVVRAFGCTPTGDVRVRIEEFQHAPLWHTKWQGNSAGGALALGLASLWMQTPLQAGVVTSFALAPEKGRVDGNCHPIGGKIAKAREVAETFGADGIFLIAREQLDEALKCRAEQIRLRLEGSQTLREALEIASGRLVELLAYLDALVDEANRVPSYYPRDARMDRVRVRVRVSSERQRFDRAWAEEQERNRLLGMADNDEAFRAYRHRFSPEGLPSRDGEDQPRIEVLDWDREVRTKVRRGVVVGDPGLGKTWLVKWEAACHADETRTRLRQTSDLSTVTIPIHRRLADVAAALKTLEMRYDHGEDDLPTLPDAVIESLRTWQMPSAGTRASRKLSESTLGFLRERLGTEHVLLLLDAFDEVPAEQRPALLRVLGEWVPGNPQARVLLTSRVVGYQPPWTLPDRSDSEREMELLPFDDEQMGRFVEAFFAGESAAAPELRDLLRRTPQVRGMAQIPLLLGFVCALFREERARPAGERRDLSKLRRTDLYEAVLQRLLAGRWKELPRPPREGEVEAKLELLEPVAFQLFMAGKEQFTLREVRQAFRTAHAALYPRATLSDTEVTSRIQEWSEQDGLLVKAGAGADAPYLFLHLTFQEYLAACHLAERINNHGGWDKAVVPVGSKEIAAKVFVDRKAWLPNWQEVIVLLAGKVHDAVPLLELLSDDATDDVFRHRLALAALCLPEIKELLEAP
jgi:hypothetical protein